MPTLCGSRYRRLLGEIYIDGNSKTRKLHYEQFGRGDDVILLHGWGASASAFLFVAKRLSKEYRTTVLDFAGFGESDEPSEGMSVADYANDVLVLMDRLGISKATLVGHSFGGRVALYLSALKGERVNKLVLVDSAGLKPRRGLKYYAKVYLHKILKKLGKRGLKGSADYRLLSPTMKETFKNVVNFDETHLLKNINCPCAVFWGKDDCETPRYMHKRFLKEIRGAQGFLLDGGHFAYVDDNVKFLLILEAFLKE